MTDTVEQRCPACAAKNRIPSERLGEGPRCGRCQNAIFPGVPVTVTDQTFADLVEGCAIPVLVDFWAPWCGPCRQMEPSLEAAAAQRVGEVRVAKINVDENPALARRFAIRSIPALKLFRGATVADELTGAVPAGALAQFLDRHTG